MTAILGISSFYHDSAACLVVDGELRAAAQEERFTRKKHDPGFPRRAVDYCLNEAGIRAADLDYVVFYEKPMRKLERLVETYVAFAPAGFRSFAMALLCEKTISSPNRTKTTTIGSSQYFFSWRRNWTNSDRTRLLAMGILNTSA